MFFLSFQALRNSFREKDNFHMSLASFTMPRLVLSKEQHVNNDNCDDDDDYDYDSN